MEFLKGKSVPCSSRCLLFVLLSVFSVIGQLHTMDCSEIILKDNSCYKAANCSVESLVQASTITRNKMCNSFTKWAESDSNIGRKDKQGTLPNGLWLAKYNGSQGGKHLTINMQKKYLWYLWVLITLNEWIWSYSLKWHHIQFSQHDDVTMMCIFSINLLSDSRGSLQRRASNWIPSKWLQRQELCAQGAQIATICRRQHQNR